MTGNQSAWPVYITVGNLSKQIRLTPSSNAVLLLALLPKFPKGFQASNTCEEFHKALTLIFNPIKDLYTLGTDIDCADGYVQRYYPRLAAWIGDTPELSLFTSVIGGFCSVCKVPKDCLENQSSKWERRTIANSRKRALSHVEVQSSNNSSEDDSVQEHQQVPFTERLWPGFDRYRIVAPDLLHQLHLGLFKHYLIPWTLELLKQANSERPVYVKVPLVDALNKRLAYLPRFQGLRALLEGRLSSMSQLTGKEYRQISRIFIPAVAPLLLNHPSHVEVIRVGSDFMMLASYTSHNQTTVDFLQKSLLRFDKLK
jgi:hypothetical protein